jgi:ABC-2 type transport system permease protein
MSETLVSPSAVRRYDVFAGRRLSLLVSTSSRKPSASYAAGLVLKTEDSMASVLNSIAVPLLLLSGILLPMSLAPSWLRVISDVNPVKHIVDAVRSVFMHIGTATVGWGLVATIGLVVAGMAFGTRTFMRESS